MPLTTMEEDMKWKSSQAQSAGQRTCSEHPCKRRSCGASRVEACAAALSTALSLVAFGICVLVYLRTSELQSRVLSLEKQRDPELSGWISLQQVEPILLSRLDQMLEEKLAARLPKVRETREVPHSCLCPPGMSAFIPKAIYCILP
ncbi:collagen alpha-1(XIII) chain-like [Astyanax mexicanus]|uniref:collagen alpha-1(XIII) chain-like n=1 Tax=Astyanax mexicanus TaxID=7994 RepID=UPI0020CB4C32|nr:collagen alpha-1(XIII) chain-like [Astyanax mexicanus]